MNKDKRKIKIKNISKDKIFYCLIYLKEKYYIYAFFNIYI